MQTPQKLKNVDYTHLPLIHALPTVVFTGFARHCTFEKFLRLLEPHKPLDAFIPNNYLPNTETDELRVGYVGPCAYAVFATLEEAEHVVNLVNEIPGGSQIGKAALCEYEMLLKSLFPTLFQIGVYPAGTCITLEGLNTLIEICDIPQKFVNFNHPERPFETFMAILHHFPWHMLPPLLPPVSTDSVLYESLSHQALLIKAAAPKVLTICYNHLTDVHKPSRIRWDRVTDRFSKRLLKAVLAIPVWTFQEQDALLTEGMWDPSYRKWCVDWTQVHLNTMVDEWTEEKTLKLRGCCGGFARPIAEKFIMNQEMPWLMSNVKRVWRFAREASAQSTPETKLEQSAASTPTPTPKSLAHPTETLKHVTLQDEVEFETFNGLPIVSAFPPFRPIGFPITDPRDVLRTHLYQCLSAAHQLSRSPLGPQQFEQESRTLEETRRSGGDDVLMLANMVLGHLIVAQGKTEPLQVKDP
jgi:hypothetical protein